MFTMCVCFCDWSTLVKTTDCRYCWRLCLLYILLNTFILKVIIIFVQVYTWWTVAAGRLAWGGWRCAATWWCARTGGRRTRSRTWRSAAWCSPVSSTPAPSPTTRYPSPSSSSTTLCMVITCTDFLTLSDKFDVKSANPYSLIEDRNIGAYAFTVMIGCLWYCVPLHTSSSKLCNTLHLFELTFYSLNYIANCIVYIHFQPPQYVFECLFFVAYHTYKQTNHF